MSSENRLASILRKNEARILEAWLESQNQASGRRLDAPGARQVADDSRRFLSLLGSSLGNGTASIESSDWDELKGMLSHFSRSRAQHGFTPSETAMFIFSLKPAIFDLVLENLKDDPAVMAEEMRRTSLVLDQLGLFTTEVHQRSREEIISRQQNEMLEFSTPVVKLWDGVLALPLVGTLDSSRTQVVMETLLQRIVETGSGIAIIDITGVPVVDTLVAQHLLKTIAAARLMGAECILSGIRPQIAQTIVHLGVELNDVITKATLADAFQVALQRLNLSVIRVQN